MLDSRFSMLVRGEGRRWWSGCCVGLCRHEIDASELDAFHTEQIIGDLVDLADRPSQDNHLLAVVLVEMHVQR